MRFSPDRWQRVFPIGMLTMLLIGLPLLGAYLAGYEVSHYLEFPPLTQPVQPAPFALAAVIILGGLAGLSVLILFYPYRALQIRWSRAPKHLHFPYWGWASLFIGLALWWIAWSTMPFNGVLRPYAFTPLWCSFIVFVNACTQARTGHCTLKDRTRYFLSLFPLSALFWWYFEYLNRYVQNWHYIHIESDTAMTYVLRASLAFATVLPAVHSMTEWLESYVQPGFLPNARLRVPRPRLWAQIVLAVASATLVGIAVWPNFLYPMLWVAPLLLLLALSVLVADASASFIIRPRLIDLHRARLAALAALLCGGFWEMWNYHSDPKWVYAVPYVGTYKIFEMPLLGYFGYLPFGIECLVVSTLLAGVMNSSSKRESGGA